MELKDTLLMPKTEFSMRGNLAENEKEMRTIWDEIDIYNTHLKNSKGKPSFTLHDGPPYANNNIHLGHAFQKILKDFINRSRMMMGYSVEFIPGWDCHGLPVETAVTNSGIDRKSMPTSEFRKLCREYSLKQVELQKQDFIDLNVIGDWDHPYLTLDKTYEAKQIEVFAKMAEKGLIFKGLKPIYWSPSSESALAEAEIEYHDKKDPSIYVAFPVVKGNDKVNPDDYLVIWTTTPWTLPGNLAIAAGPNFEYVKVNVKNKNYIVAKELLKDLSELFEWEDYKVADTFKGRDLNDVEYKHIFMDRTSPVVMGDNVTLDTGTGLVHTAPGYGEDDFNLGRKYNLGLISAVNDQGVLTEESGIFKDLFYDDANKEITKWLDENGYLLKLKFITHSYPHDWRTKKPIIFRATPQWFCSIDKIRQEVLDILDNEVEFHTEWGYTRIYNMIKDRGDWCISRQRSWGVPIPIFYNEDGSEIIDYDVIMHVSDLFREYGSNVWFERDAKDLLPKGYTNPLSPNGKFTKEEDTMDVWFDSGTSWNGVLVERNMPYPADIYLEGSDQYRGWFNSSLLCSAATNKKSPFKKLLSTGFVLDSKGYKMSKSLGNVVKPMNIVKKHGSDILRLWTLSTDFTDDVRFGEEILDQVKESYRKIRNTYRFMLGNLFDFDTKNLIEYKDMTLYNQYMMVRLNEFTKEVIKSYEDYNFDEIYKLINNYITYYLSTFYLDFTKDILYIEEQNSKVRREVQSVLYHHTLYIAKLLAPVLPYTSEEVYKLLPNANEKSIHLSLFPEVIEYKNGGELIKLGDTFFKIKDDVYKSLEEARDSKLIGKALEAKVYINAKDEYKEVLEKLKSDLKRLFIVSDVALTEEDLPKYSVVGVKVEVFNGVKCERCWNYYEKEDIVDDICPRCTKVIEKL